MSYQQQQNNYPSGLPPTGYPTIKPNPYINYYQQTYPYTPPINGQYIQPTAPPMPSNMQYTYNQQPYSNYQYTNYPNYPNYQYSNYQYQPQQPTTYKQK